jgi:excisionase family DNA binding protein
MITTNAYREDGQHVDPMITKRDLAERLGISQRWIEYRMTDGLPFVRMGRAVRFQPTQVMSWIASQQENGR